MDLAVELDPRVPPASEPALSSAHPNQAANRMTVLRGHSRHSADSPQSLSGMFYFVTLLPFEHPIAGRVATRHTCSLFCPIALAVTKCVAIADRIKPFSYCARPRASTPPDCSITGRICSRRRGACTCSSMRVRGECGFIFPCIRKWL